MIEAQVKVKVCGLTEVENAVTCANNGADWIGLNFHPGSSRSISVAQAAEIARALHDRTIARVVGLFVDRPLEEVAQTTRSVGLDLIQLHGDESPEYLAACRTLLPAVPIVRAFRLSSTASVVAMLAYLDRLEQLGSFADAVLVDAHVPGQAGGTGQSLSFDLLDQLPRLPRLILAGGLTPENVANRVDRVQPWMVDVASGVESSPGVKDLVKVTAFVNAVHKVSGKAD